MPIQQSTVDESPSVAEIWKSWIFIPNEFPPNSNWRKSSVIAFRLQVSTDQELVKSSTWPGQRQHADPTATIRRKLVHCGDLEVLIIIRNGSTSSWTNREVMFLSFSYGFQRIWIHDRTPPSGPNNANIPICFASWIRRSVRLMSIFIVFTFNVYLLFDGVKEDDVNS